MPENTPRRHSTSEKGHAKFMESLDRLVAVDARLDAARLNAPDDLKSDALVVLRAAARAAADTLSDGTANFRTAAAAAREADDELLDAKAAQAIAALEARGASAATVEDARSYLRKLRGDRKTVVKDDPATVGIDESAGGISTAQLSYAARLDAFEQLVDFLEAQTAYQSVSGDGLKIADLRGFAAALRVKHNAAIAAGTFADQSRGRRDGIFYTAESSVLNLAKRYKKLVFSAYGSDSDEYRMVNEIPFQKQSA